MFRAADVPLANTSPAGPRYLRVTYLDHGYNRLRVTYKNADGKWLAPDKSTGVVLLDSGRWVTSYHRCPGPVSQPFETQFKLDQPERGDLAISEVATQFAPYPDRHFRYMLDEAWKRPYTGPSLPADNGSLQGRVMVGYQGWFRTPNDPCDVGWRHWGDIGRGLFSVDMWPDPANYPADCLDKAADVRTLSGKVGYLFSPAWPEVPQRHFAWMREHRIDGAFVQRFVSRDNLYSLGGAPEWVLGNVREAANREGRLWVVEYDISGAPDERLLEFIKTDWKWLIDEFDLRRDANYAREGDKLIVAVWGLPFPDRHISVKTADAVLDFLQHDPQYGGNYVVGGVPAWWERLDPAWCHHVARYDAALAWQSQNYAADFAAFQKIGVTYYAMAFPGFSWANLKHLPTGSTEAFSPRADGQFYEAQLSKIVSAGVDHLFIGMFDEYDEGTAIMPMSDDPPPTNRRPGTNARFLAPDDLDGNGQEIRLPQIDLTLDDKPPAKGISGTDFKVRFRGQLVPHASGQYTFSVEGASGDAATLWVGDQRLDIKRLDGAAQPKLTVQLQQGAPVVYKLDYQHRDGLGRLRLLWESEKQPTEPVPTSVYQDAWGRFLTNEGQPADWWLTLTGRWRDALRKAPPSPAASP